MDKGYFEREIKQLPDDKLKELLQLRNKENLEIMKLAEKEAIERGVDLETIEVKIKQSERTKSKNSGGRIWPSILADVLFGLF
jgi:succinate dehydrogenase flavin-adding protein (antitoxin of CptAB toxin-antitoxin module)